MAILIHLLPSCELNTQLTTYAGPAASSRSIYAEFASSDAIETIKHTSNGIKVHTDVGLLLENGSRNLGVVGVRSRRTLSFGVVTIAECVDTVVDGPSPVVERKADVVGAPVVDALLVVHAPVVVTALVAMVVVAIVVVTALVVVPIVVATVVSTKSREQIKCSDQLSVVLTALSR